MLGSVAVTALVLAEGIAIGIQLEKSGMRKNIQDKCIHKFDQLKRKVNRKKHECEYYNNSSLEVFRG